MANLSLHDQCQSDSMNTLMDLTFDSTEPTMRSSSSSRAEHIVLDMLSSSRGFASFCSGALRILSVCQNCSGGMIVVYMSFKILRVREIEPSFLVDGADQNSLRISARHRHGRGFSILIDPCTPNHSTDWIAISNSVTHAFKDNDSNPSPRL